jgi:hypothetical protein
MQIGAGGLGGGFGRGFGGGFDAGSGSHAESGEGVIIDAEIVDTNTVDDDSMPLRKH